MAQPLPLLPIPPIQFPQQPQQVNLPLPDYNAIGDALNTLAVEVPRVANAVRVYAYSSGINSKLW